MDGGGWDSVQEDVTEQRQRERILERMERFLATIIENVAEGIIAKDQQGRREDDRHVARRAHWQDRAGIVLRGGG